MKSLIRAIKAERIKFRHSPVFLVFPILSLLAAGMGVFNYLGNIEALKFGWYDLWGQETLFTCSLFIPAEIAAVCAWQWHLEHSEHCWNRIMTAPVSFTAQYLAKLFWAAIISLFAIAITGILFILSGPIAGLSLADLPPRLYEWLLCGWLGAVTISAASELLAMYIRKYSIPVILSVLSGIAGLLLMAYGHLYVWPWSLFSLGMRANNAKMIINLPLFICACLIWITALTAAACLTTRHRDIRSE
jgi:ABC-2 type transport system permease protein